MKMEKIELQENHWIEETARICGDVTVGCAEAAGVLEKALTSADWLKSQHNKLTELTLRLDNDIADVTQATSEAQNLSDSAVSKLMSGTSTIEMSMERFAKMISLIESLGAHITGFAAAMEQVKRVSQTIDTIARTTNMLALNAAIEAEKAGEAGQTFAVVASEVKKLAQDTRQAAVEITGTVNSLSNEASKFVVQIEDGVASSGAAQQQFSSLQMMINGVTDVVGQVGDHNREIANSTAAIHRSLTESQRVRDAVANANGDMFQAVGDAHSQIVGLESRANRMFDNLVHSGFSRDDMAFVEMAMVEASNLAKMAEAAVVSGELTTSALFDQKLVPIPGSNPPRFTTQLTTWADRCWRPKLEEVKGKRREILTAVCSSKTGFLPTHHKEFSRQSTGDVDHDTRYCRNGRVFFEGIDLIAKASEQDYMMAVYRHSGASNANAVVRNVYVPLYINGQRWGDFEIAYVI
jgi:methyl-accepting chemotaxis protein